MADSPGFRVHVTRTITYAYDEHFFDPKGITDLELTLSDTVKFRDDAHTLDGHATDIRIDLTRLDKPHEGFVGIVRSRP